MYLYDFVQYIYIAIDKVTKDIEILWEALCFRQLPHRYC